MTAGRAEAGRIIRGDDNEENDWLDGPAAVERGAVFL